MQIFHWALISIALVLGLSSIRVIPEATFGVVLRFRKRTGRVLKEGLRFVWPLIEQVELFSIELEADPIVVSFVCGDNVEVFVKGSLQWRPDPDVTYEKDRDKKRVRFVEIKEETIVVGIKDAIKSILGIVGGKRDAKELITERLAIELLVNCSLRLKHPPHLFPELYPPREYSKKHPERDYPKFEKRFTAKDDNGKDVKVKVKHENGVPPEHRIAFYKKNAQKAREILDYESENPHRHSTIEKRYGIDIETFALADVDLTPKYKDTIESVKRAEAEAKAAAELAKKFQELVTNLTDQKMDITEASNRAAILLGLGKHFQIIEGGAMPFINLQQKGGD